MNKTRPVPVLVYECFDPVNGNNCWVEEMRLIGEKEEHESLIKRFKKCDVFGRKTRNVKIRIFDMPIIPQ